MEPKKTPVDWRSDWVREAAEAMERALREKVRRPRSPVKYVLILDWKGWRLVQEFSELPAMGTDFISNLPNGKRGLFTRGEEFVSSTGLPGYIYYCKEEL